MKTNKTQQNRNVQKSSILKAKINKNLISNQMGGLFGNRVELARLTSTAKARRLRVEVEGAVAELASNLPFPGIEMLF